MEMYHGGMSGHLKRERYASKDHHLNALQQEKNYEHLKEVEHQRELLEKKCEELQLKHSEIEQREKDLRMKVALDAYEQLCLNIGNDGRSSIRQLLVNLCQGEFEKNFEVQSMFKNRSKKIAQADKEVRSELESLFEKEFLFAQTRAQGNIWMIGELYNYGILSDNMILYFISRLLDEFSDISWLWLCELILTVHTSLVKNEVAVDKYFKKIKEIFKGKTQLSKNSETLLQNIILDWEAKADPDSTAALAEDKRPNSEPVTYKPTVYTVQSYDKPSFIDHRPFREFHNKQRGGGKRGRYRGVQGLGSGTHPSYRPPAYSSVMPTSSGDSYSDWYEQNVSSAYSLTKYRSFNQAPSDGHALYGMRQGRPEHDIREQKMKKKARQQQNQHKAQELSFAAKKDLLDGEMKIGFRKQTQTKAKDEKKSVVQQNSEVQCSPTAPSNHLPENTELDKRESTASPQHKLWSALCVKLEDEPNCTDNQLNNKEHKDTTSDNKEDKVGTSENIQVPDKMKPNVPKTKILSSEISKIAHSQEDDVDVLILSELVTEEIKPAVKAVCHVESPKYKGASMSSSVVKVITDDRKSEGELPCECSSGTSEYSSPMESPVPCESEDKLWECKQTLPETRETTLTSANDMEKAKK